MATAIDQPTPPDLGNITDAQFRALVDWKVQAMNIEGKDDTFKSMDDCVIALLYRLILENFAYVSNALACRVSTPLGIAAKAAATDSSQHWKETDFPALALSNDSISGITPLPTILLNGNGNSLDARNGVLRLNPPPPGESITYSIVSSGGCTGEDDDDYPIVYGVRTHAGRYVWLDDNAVVKEKDMAFQCSYALPEWPQDTAESIVLAKVADRTSAVDVGPAGRIGFEFGLGEGDPLDPNSDNRDYVLYVRWFNSSDVEQRAIAVLPLGPYAISEPISITPGRRITLGFHRFFDEGLTAWAVIFFVNGIAVTDTIGPFLEPDISASSDISLHIGSAQLGQSYTGGPWNNASIWQDADQALIADAMLSLYRRGEGCEKVVTPT